MATLDWVALGVLALSLLLGIWRGLVFEVLSVLGWLAAFVLAQWFAPQVSGMLPMAGSHEAVRYAAAFVVVFIATVFAAGLLAWLTKKLIASVGLAPADRALGGLFGLVRGVVLLLGLAVVVHMTALKDGMWWKESVTSGIATAMLRGMKPVLPAKFAAYLPD
jgi:membrane protein required for colicin V production